METYRRPVPGRKVVDWTILHVRSGTKICRILNQRILLLRCFCGKPDIAITKYKIAIFCDGEFFHGRDWEVLKPRLEKSNNSQYWISKISKNRERDDQVNKQLLFRGWTVIRFWGNDIKKHTEECIQVVEEAIFDQKLLEIEASEKKRKETGQKA